MMVDTDTATRPPDGGPSRRGRIVAALVAVVLGIAVVAGVAWGAASLISHDDGWDVIAGQPVQVSIASGTTARIIYADLEAAGVARSVDLEAAAVAIGAEDRLQAGTYTFVTDMDPVDVIASLVEGGQDIPGTTFTLVEGWTVDRIVEELAEALPFTQAEFQAVLRSDAITSPYLPPVGGPVDAINRWEGLLFPATYPITEGTTPAEILGAMADQTVRRIDAIDTSRLPSLGVSLHEALVIASLVEREAGTDDERATIASVIYNRLFESMRLQIDATVIYALGYNPGRVTATHLDTDSPWNTYRVDGLPPTPIGAASQASIEAATNPASTTYLFYVLGGTDGSHRFAETYEEHQANIARARADGVLP